MEHAAPRRRPAEGGYARGLETRQRIIDAALHVFGEEGYARASTRQIALRAGVNPPALQYYFDSKEGLHLACAEYIVQDAWLRLNPAIEAAEQAELEWTDRDTLIENVCAILDALADYGLGSQQSESRKQFMARGQSVDAGPAYDVIRGLSSRLHRACARLVAGVLDRSPTDTNVLLKSLAILGQLTTFSVGRTNALASLGWQNFEGERLKSTKAILRENTRAILQDASPASSTAR